MTSVLKYPLKRAEVQDVALPVGAKILSAESKDREVVVYALADKEVTEKDTYRFYVYGTGVELSAEVTIDMFLGTVVMGSAAVHVFKRQLAPEEVEVKSDAEDEAEVSHIFPDVMQSGADTGRFRRS